MSALIQRKTAMILALAFSLAVSLIVLATDSELRERLGMTYWVLGLAIIGSILLVLAGYVWDRTMMDRLREINQKARAQADEAETDGAANAYEPEPDFSGEQDEIIGVARQIERMAQTLQKMEASYRGIVEDQVDLICRYKANGALTFTNSSFSRFFGRKRAELAGKTFPVFDLGYPTRDFQGHLPERDSFEVELTPADAEELVSYQWTHRAIKSAASNILEYQAVGHDISDRKAAEAALITAKESAESAARAKSEFLAVVSHEVRTPINAIIGFSKLMRDTTLSSDQEEYLDNIHQSGMILEGLIADILDVSRLEAGQLEIKSSPFTIRESVDEVRKHLSPIALKAELKLSFNTDPSVPVYLNGDEVRLRQLLMNVIGNALKFTEQGSVKVSVECARASEVSPEGVCGLRLFVEVTDTGIGIPPDRIKDLLKPFNQIDPSSTRRRGGTGLGLVIAKRLCELMGRAISVDSTPGVGSTFRFSLALTYEKGDSKPSIQETIRRPDLPSSPATA